MKLTLNGVDTIQCKRYEHFYEDQTVIVAMHLFEFLIRDEFKTNYSILLKTSGVIIIEFKNCTKIETELEFVYLKQLVVDLPISLN